MEHRITVGIVAFDCFGVAVGMEFRFYVLLKTSDAGVRRMIASGSCGARIKLVEAVVFQANEALTSRLGPVDSAQGNESSRNDGCENGMDCHVPRCVNGDSGSLFSHRCNDMMVDSG